MGELTLCGLELQMHDLMTGRTPLTPYRFFIAARRVSRGREKDCGELGSSGVPSMRSGFRCSPGPSEGFGHTGQVSVRESDGQTG